jgi:5,5'-dehydrodivanillate O-demethylase
MVMWYTQGEITDREEEHLGYSDKGVIAFRNQLKENLRRVEAGQDPMNVFRDPAGNSELELPVEEHKLGGSFDVGAGQRRAGNSSKYSPIFRAIEEAATGLR